MNSARTRPPFSAVVVAAGKGQRAGQPVPKQFKHWRGKPLVRHSVEALLNVGTERLLVAIPAGFEELAADALDGLAVEFVTGGTTRQDTVATSLEALGTCDYVLIHDAARPILPTAVIERLLAALERADGAIPVLPVIDSLAVEKSGLMQGSVPREELRRVQTPQAFRFEAILAAHRNWIGPATAGDDAQVLQAAEGTIAMVVGDEALRKLTVAEDFATHLPIMRTGMGYDVHRLVKGEELWLCGIRIDHEAGLAGHSDADVALHAIVDALLGAIGDGDIGTHFPPTNPLWKGVGSDRFLLHAADRVRKSGYRIGNIDLTLICEQPKIGPHRPAMRQRIADLVGVDIDCVSVKATTTEQLGFTGRGEGIAAQAIATVMRETGI